MATKLKLIEHRVANILLIKAETRNNDYALYAEYIDRYAHDIAGMSICKALKSNMLPNFESVTRTRRKVQAENPELRGDTYRGRQEKQEKYKDYAKS